MHVHAAALTLSDAAGSEEEGHQEICCEVGVRHSLTALELIQDVFLLLCSVSLPSFYPVPL